MEKEIKPLRENKITIFEKIASRITQFTGSATAFMAALGLVLALLISGPFFQYSDTWKLFITNSITIITFLMVFIIQHSQNKDTKALHLKLNELIMAMKGASNELVDAENLSEADLQTLSDHYEKVAEIPIKNADSILAEEIEKEKEIRE